MQYLPPLFPLPQCNQQGAEAEDSAVLVVLRAVVHLQLEMARESSTKFLYQLEIRQQDAAGEIATIARALKLTTILPVANVTQPVNLAGGERIL